MNEEKTIYVSAQEKEPRLICLWEGEIHEFPLSGIQSFGRATKNNHPDLNIPVLSVSREHGSFCSGGGRCRYCDLGSSNGTSCNGKPLPPHEYHELKDGDVLRIHGREDEERLLDILMVYSTGYHTDTTWKKLRLTGEIAEIRIGRAETLTLNDQSVSRQHASFFSTEHGWAIIDHNSLNGVYVNNHRISNPVYLSPMDVVKISGYLFFFTGDCLYYQEEEEVGFARPTEQSQQKQPQPEQSESKEENQLPVREPEPQEERQLSVREPQKDNGALSIYIEERNVWHRMKKKTLLKDIRLEIAGGSLVLILGGSGAGKTTFMNAVMGYEEAEGQILYKDTDIYEEYRKMKYEIGYVPQQDLLRMNDTVYSTLLNAARMRLPHCHREDYQEAVQKTLQTLGLEREQDALVGKLSGGQRKRLSIAVEYIGNPSLFFLDEPDSGLDGTMACALMENLRTIADEGKIVMVISHSPDRAFELFDQVIVLAKDSRDNCGHLVYTGAPEAACRFFDVDNLEHIVKRINRKDEGGDGLADYYIERYAAQGGES